MENDKEGPNVFTRFLQKNLKSVKWQLVKFCDINNRMEIGY